VRSAFAGASSDERAPARNSPEEAAVAWIRVIGPDEAQGELAAFYEGQRASAEQRRRLWGATSDDWARNPAAGNLMSLNPAAARAYQQLSQVVNYGDGPLTQAQRQMIATVVSAGNRCVY
jgi:alkylhydroperoxidase family enzyme